MPKRTLWSPQNVKIKVQQMVPQELIINKKMKKMEAASAADPVAGLTWGSGLSPLASLKSSKGSDLIGLRRPRRGAAARFPPFGMRAAAYFREARLGPSLDALLFIYFLDLCLDDFGFVLDILGCVLGLLWMCWIVLDVCLIVWDCFGIVFWLLCFLFVFDCCPSALALVPRGTVSFRYCV